MRFFSFLLLALPTAIRADYQTVLDDIDSISTQLASLTESVDAVAPGIPGLSPALQVQVDATTLDKEIVAGASHAADSPPFANGSLQVGLALIALQPTITDALGQISEKNTTFGELGIIVLASLTQLKRNTDAFAEEIVPKLGALEAALAPGVIKAIDGAFDGAIAAALNAIVVELAGFVVMY
ncbi:cell wall mannoprotein 1 family protein [Aspergillus lucknowensis]|uniref:Hydrophobic surface binding protein A-domain-containing protein n=1 Tax=Aspergillus lucknowensis TaxID=176173 RepID=A0ABR4LNH9_9EURO